MAEVTWPPGAGGGGGGGGAVTVADGADVNAGATTDAAVVTDANGTLSGKIRGLVRMLADVWDDAANLFRVSVQNTVTVSDGGGSVTVDGTVTVTEPVSVDDNGSTLSIDDGGGSITVDGTVTAQSAPAPPNIVVESTAVTAPGANTILCDTGQLAAGVWLFHLEITAADNKNVTIQHRDSTNANTLFSWVASMTTTTTWRQFDIACTMAANERLRITNIAASSAGIVYTTSIHGWKVS